MPLTKTIVETMLYGAGEPADSVIPPNAIGFSDQVVTYEYNIEKAKELMAEAGYETASPVRFL